MRIVCISDTHTFHDDINVPDGDLLIHSGDATIGGTVKEVAAFGNWWNDLPHKHKVFVAGNHDWLWQTDPYLARSFVPDLRDDIIEIEGLKIYGTPWTPMFMNWAFMLDRGEPIANRWKLIPDDIDILITHGPPHGVRDEIGGLNVGCRDLLEVVKRVKPKFHIFGHIHDGYGQIELYGINFINVAICDEAYIPSNKPIVIDT